jgi:hypothetical protein
MFITLIILANFFVLTVERAFAVASGRIIWIVLFILDVIALALLLLPFAHVTS